MPNDWYSLTQQIIPPTIIQVRVVGVPAEELRNIILGFFSEVFYDIGKVIDHDPLRPFFILHQRHESYFEVAFGVIERISYGEALRSGLGWQAFAGWGVVK